MRAPLIITLCGTAVLLAACSTPPEAPPTVTIREDGCVTSGVTDNEFILTDLEPGERNPDLQHGKLQIGAQPRPMTEAYRLIGDTDELQPLVGRRARVVGEARRDGELEIRELDRPEPARVQDDDGPSDEAPVVNTVEQVSLEIHDLHVTSIEPTGDSCAQPEEE